MNNLYINTFILSMSSSMAATSAAYISNYTGAIARIPLKGAALSGGLGMLMVEILDHAGAFNREHYKNFPILNKIGTEELEYIANTLLTTGIATTLVGRVSSQKIDLIGGAILGVGSSLGVKLLNIIFG